MEKLLTVGEVAPLFRLKVGTLYRSPEWRAKLGFEKFGGKLLTRESVIQQILTGADKGATDAHS